LMDRIDMVLFTRMNVLPSVTSKSNICMVFYVNNVSVQTGEIIGNLAAGNQCQIGQVVVGFVQDLGEKVAAGGT
jgi:hypothetical protein